MLVTDRFIITNVTEIKRLTASEPTHEMGWQEAIWLGAESMDAECLSCHGRWLAVSTGPSQFERHDGATVVRCPRCGATEAVPDRALRDEATL